MMQLVLIIRTKRKETVAKDLDKRFYYSHKSQCTCRKRINHPHHGQAQDGGGGGVLDGEEAAVALR
jgi:hypothetical protein